MHKSRKLVVVITLVAAMVVSGIAFAVWSSNGTGSGNAKALTAVNVTVNATTGAADLYPGGSGKVWFTFTNTNPYAITFTSLTAASVTGVTGGIGGSPACATTDLSLAAVPIAGSWTVGASTTSPAQSVDTLVTMKSTAPDACQGATFTLSLTFTGSQS